MELLDGSLAMHLVIGSFSRSPLRHMQHAERCTRHRVARDIGERGAELELHDCPERVCSTKQREIDLFRPCVLRSSLLLLL